MQNALILLICLVVAGVLVYPPLARARIWQATITPLASIIGSGFLILGPILDASYGVHAPIVMAALCLGAFAFGGAIRFNIRRIEARGGLRSTAEMRLETMSSWALAFAYIISVAYYLNLFGGFSVSLTPLDDDFHARLVTSAVLLLILFVGWTRGFKTLEQMEQVSVGIKLSIIAGLLFALASYFLAQARSGGLILNPPAVRGWSSVTLAFGLLVTVQGFETSRYLGRDYDAQTRIGSMRLAQLISAAIYMIYICLLAFVFPAGMLDLDETAIIDMMDVVAPILPGLLVAAALSAQFSAAVADTSGSGGLISELTNGRVSPRMGYAILVCSGLMLTWSLNVFQIISYASRAFALYYTAQAAIAALGAWRSSTRRYLAPFFLALALLGILIVLFGATVE